MIHSHLEKKSINLQAIFWIILTKFSFVFMMALVKASNIPSLQVNFCRSLSIWGIVGLIIAFNKNLTFKTTNFKLQITKVSIGAFGMIGYFYSFRHLEMAKASTLGFTQSLVLPILAYIFLREKVGWRRILAILIGYGGIWVAIDPVYGSFEAAEGVILIASICGAAAVICAKKLTAKDSPLLLMFYSGMATSVILGLYYLLTPKGFSLAGYDGTWISLTWHDIPLFIGIISISLLMQYGYLKSYSLADVGFLAPFNYLKFLVSSGISFFYFQQTPAPETFIGAALIIGSTLYLAKKEIHQEPQYHYKDKK